MTGELGYSLPPAVRRIATAFHWAGWVSLWTQIVLAVISSLILLLASLSIGENTASSGSANPGTGAGLFLASLGLLTVYGAAYWAFRYTRMGRRLRTSNPDLRPKPKDAATIIRIGIMISLVGMVLTLLGTQAIVGSLFGKSISGGLRITPVGIPDVLRVTSLDILVVQGTLNILLAHFVGLCGSLWLSWAVNRQ